MWLIEHLLRLRNPFRKRLLWTADVVNEGHARVINRGQCCQIPDNFIFCEVSHVTANRGLLVFRSLLCLQGGQVTTVFII